MKGPTDEQIFNHMKPDDDEIDCSRCGGEVKTVAYDDYVTHRCLVCSYEPGMPEEF